MESRTKSVLVVGGGGRCHAIVDALSRSTQVAQIYCAPGNAGIAEQAECVAIGDTDIDALEAFAKQKSIDLTVVGPEASLAAGIVDRFRQAGLLVFGPSKAATAIESSKEFAKKVMVEAAIPTAAYRVFDQYNAAKEYVTAHGAPVVLKYDGLAAGKGVVVAMSIEQADNALRNMLLDESFGHGRVVVEEYMEGPEFSFMCFVAGEEVCPMPAAQDHKRAFDGDKGPNTGGMGAYTPLPFITADDMEFALERIMKPAARQMVADGVPFTGVLYGGLMKTVEGIRVVEFNARFGDPETEVVLPLLRSDIFDIFASITAGRGVTAEWDNRAVMGTVLASKGYPGSYTKGARIGGLDRLKGVRVYQMGTARKGGELVTAGGRVMMVVSEGDTIAEARSKVYDAIGQIDCDNLFYRTDIAHQALL